ncbi:MAG TPA: DUF4149 domain-containing protein [Terriglobales bacterium]|nr:DUF4149 domain-containing protein [Terriglobales bacterium]
MTALRFFMLLALVIWIGGIIYFAAVVAPVVFSGILPTRHMSGMIVSRVLTTLHWMGIVCGGVFLVLSVMESYYAGAGWQATALRNVFVFGMIVATLFSQLVVAVKMEALRAQMGEIDSVAATDPRRIAFDRLHQWSTSLEVLVLLLGLAALWMVARHWSIPFSTAGSAQNLPPRSSSAFHS